MTANRKITRSSTSLLALLAVATLTVPEAGQSQDVRRPQEMFPYEVSADENAIHIDFDVADGGYLYREEFRFASADGRVQFGAARFPRGEMYLDVYLSEEPETHEIYRGEFRVTIPYSRSARVDSVELEMELRGCDDIVGLCYPPQDWTATVALPQAVLSEAGGLSGSLFAGPASDEPLPVEQAFDGNARFDSANELTVTWQIAPGYYLYRDQFSFAVDGEIQFGAARLPEGVAHEDLTFGEVEVYYNFVEVVVPFARAHPDEQQLSITAGFRGCKDDSICYPPSEKIFALTLPAAGEFASSTPPAKESEQDRLAALISDGSLVLVVGSFLLIGLGLSLTPCVYPMVPILSSIIAGQNRATGDRSFMLSVSYVLGMAVTYAVAGAITALAGNQVQAIFQKPWIIASAAGIMALMALSMFGLFEIQMPTAIQSRVSGLANRQKGGSLYGTAVIGALSALIVTTCVAPPLIGALYAIGQTGDVARGSLALFVMAIGMGTPLLLIGASAGQLLPKVGPWMNTIKAGFGVVMVGMAIWMLDRLLPATVILLLWALLVFITGVFLGAFDSLGEQPRPVRRLAKGLGVLACLYGALMLIGWTLGGDDPFEPIPRGGGFLGQVQDDSGGEALPFVDLESVAQLETFLGQAQAAGQPVMVDFTAEWCVACKEMEELTFPEASVVAALEPFLLLRADVTANDDDDKALLEYFQSYGPPTIAFFDRTGSVLEPYKLVGYTKADEFAAHVAEVAAL